MAMWICAISIMWMVSPAELGPRYSSRIVDTQGGPVRGIIQSSNSHHLEPVEIFYGIPYAAPPMGVRRFVVAQESLPWSGTRLADTAPPVCPQALPDITNQSVALQGMPRSRLLYLRQILPQLLNQSEDCLYLNIYVPGSGSRGMYAPYAVIVYVHGESFEWNSGNVYDGRILTSFGHVIFITLNYRLGMLGFLKTDIDSKDNQNCCFAISDIEAALRWVNTNIGAFGGDPSRVSLVGHDTGAALVSSLLLRTTARGLFNRATLLSGSMLSPWAVMRQPHSMYHTVMEQAGCRSFSCLQSLPLRVIMQITTEENQHIPRFGPWFSHSAAEELERAGDTFVERQLLLGLTSVESYCDFSAKHIDSGLDLDEKDEILRMFVKSVYSYHLKEIFSAVRNEYTEWNELMGSSLAVRDSVLEALSDGLTAAPLVQLAYLHSRRGASTYLFHLAHQPDDAIRSMVLGSIRGDILSYVLGYHLRTSDTELQDLTIAHTILRFFTNFVKTGDPNSPGAEPDYENDKGSSNIWDMYEPVKQLYLSVDKVTKVKSHYRGHKMALWLNLIQQLLSSDNANFSQRNREFEENEDKLYAGVVRPNTFIRPSGSVSTPTPASSQNCVRNNSLPERHAPPLPHHSFSLAGPWGITLAIGCLLLLCNLLLFANVYHRHFRTKASFKLQYRTVVAEEHFMTKSQSAPELATACYSSESPSPKILKRCQLNKFTV